MKLELSNTNRIAIGVVAVVAVALGFWVLVIGPKRDEASKLSAQVERVKGSLAQHEAEIAAAEQARGDFAAEYQHLVVLGKAVPNNDDTASLLVQVNQIAKRAGVRFRTLELSGESGSEEEATTTTESTPAPQSTASSPVSATEVAASTMPLGATIGPAGLGVMPYTLDFSGNFFQVADFIHGLDSLVETQKQRVAVDGRLLTINGFSLSGGKNGFPSLEATFSVTTYLTPPGQGLTGGATSESPAGAEEAVPASTTTGGVAR
jgi:Tfp pilus assembly protein PilO